MTRLLVFAYSCLLAGMALADGFTCAELPKVLPNADTILQVEILKNHETITQRDDRAVRWQKDLLRRCDLNRMIHGGNRFEYLNSPMVWGWENVSVTYAYDIESRVLKCHWGAFAGDRYDTQYSQVLVKGMWLVISASGLENHMKAGEQYVFLLNTVGGKPTLLRAEKPERLPEILKLKKELVDEDLRIAQEQLKIPDGIYRFSDLKDAQRIRLQDETRLARIGDKYDPGIIRRELLAFHDVHTLILTLKTEPPNYGILMVKGKAYRLFNGVGCYGPVYGYVSGTRPPPSLACDFKHREEAQAVADFFKIVIFQYPGEKKATVPH
jgi:hypothetical protein